MCSSFKGENTVETFYLDIEGVFGRPDQSNEVTVHQYNHQTHRHVN